MKSSSAQQDIAAGFNTYWDCVASTSTSRDLSAHAHGQISATMERNMRHHMALRPEVVQLPSFQGAELGGSTIGLLRTEARAVRV